MYTNANVLLVFASTFLVQNGGTAFYVLHDTHSSEVGLRDYSTLSMNLVAAGDIVGRGAVGALSAIKVVWIS